MRGMRIVCFGAVLTGAALLGALPAGGAPVQPALSCHGRPATVVGTPGDDDLSSDDGDFGNGDVLVLRGGDDHVEDRVPNVTVCANRGQDYLSVSEYDLANHTLLDGGPGRDRVGNFDFGEPQSSDPLLIFGQDGRDELNGGSGKDAIHGGAGDDSAGGEKGKDTLRGGSGDDRMFGGGHSDQLYGNTGQDRLKGDQGGQPEADDYANGGPQRDHCEVEVQVNCET
jgi:Ca2+-binding RTX toxin-like protein